MPELFDATQVRTPDHPVEPLFIHRWSPRAMSGQPLTEPDLMRLFEAARWAPSTYNEQEWRFLYAKRDTEAFQTFLKLLADANQAWCDKAALLCVVLSHKVFEKNGKPNPVNVFDSGSAFMALSLQGAAMNLVVHGMSGFDYDRARAELGVPEDYNVNAMFAVGHPGDKEALPEDAKEREQPSGRKPVGAIICEGKFGF